jgi:hypothetical protein
MKSREKNERRKLFSLSFHVVMFVGVNAGMVFKDEKELKNFVGILHLASSRR